MGMEAGDLRRQVMGLGRRRRGERFPVELRAKLIRYAQGQRRHGFGLGEIAEAVGVSMQSISRWTKPDGMATRALVSVVLRDERAVGTGSLTLCAPGGYQVEGLCVVTAAELLRRLA